MAGTALSAFWYRVAALRPLLRSHAKLQRHRYRGQVWFLLQDPASGRAHRITLAARLIVSAMDGQRSVQRLWELANEHFGDDAPTQDELIHLLGQLHAADLLQTEMTPDVAELFDRGSKNEAAKRRRSYMNPMSIRLPLVDPDVFLKRLMRFIRPLWSQWGVIAWLAVVLPALLLVPVHWAELTDNLSDRVLATDNLIALVLLFPLIKIWHELGHAVATKAGGGEVHDMGVMLLVLMPVPYVDASAASAFRSKFERALVGAAGVMAELFLKRL